MTMVSQADERDGLQVGRGGGGSYRCCYEFELAQFAVLPMSQMLGYQLLTIPAVAILLGIDGFRDG